MKGFDAMADPLSLFAAVAVQNVRDLLPMTTDRAEAWRAETTSSVP